MKFDLENKVSTGGLSQNSTSSQYEMTVALAQVFKSEFDGSDNGEVHLDYEASDLEKKRYTVQSALYRNIFWSTLEALDDIDESEKYLKKVKASADDNGGYSESETVNKAVVDHFKLEKQAL